MIRYSLKCKKDHGFEGWFRDSGDFDHQLARGLVRCPTCGTKQVEKALMAPNVVTSSGRKRAPQIEADCPVVGEVLPAAAGPAVAADVPAEMRAEVVAALRRFRRKVEAEAEYVGPRLADEARRIHYEEAEARSIYGEATLADAYELVEEGIPVLPLPRLPDDEN